MSEIKEYSATEAGLAHLREQYQGAVYDCASSDGDKQARKARRELVGLRGSLEQMRQAIKAPALERCRLIDSEASRIKSEILALENPIDAQIMAEEGRKEAIKAAERERVEAMQRSVRELQKIGLSGFGKSSEEISAIMQRIGDSHYTTDVESAAATDALEALTQEHAKAIEREQIQAQREADFAAREKALADQRAEDERIAVIKNRIAMIERLPIDALRWSDESIYNHLGASPIPAAHWETFGEFADQAKAATEKATEQLQAMLTQREQAAAERRAIAEQRAAIDAENARAEARRAEADRLAKIERDRLAAIAADEAAKQQAIIDRQLAEIAEANRLAKIEADAKAEADRIAKEQAEAADRQREIESATLISAACEALTFLKCRHPDELVTLKLASAIDRNWIEAA